MAQRRNDIHARICAHGNLLTNRSRSVTLPLDLSRPSSLATNTILEVFTPGPRGLRYEITAALMDSEVATISMRRNNVTLIYLRFNPIGFA